MVHAAKNLGEYRGKEVKNLPCGLDEMDCRKRVARRRGEGGRGVLMWVCCICSWWKDSRCLLKSLVEWEKEKESDGDLMH